MTELKPHSQLEEMFETVLFQCRFLALFAVIGSMVASLVLFLKGSLEICQGVMGLVHAVSYFVPTSADDKIVILAFIPAIDNYLWATVLMIFSMGMYELFVSEIDPSVRKNFSRPHWLNIDNVDDLKSQISEVVVMILIISFFQFAFTAPLMNPLDLVYLGVGILFISASLFITHKTIAHRAINTSRKHDHTKDASTP
jgi:uncharacterized membrane protein YqhA